MKGWIFRWLVVAAALASIRYSGSFEGVDVSVPGVCVAGVSTEAVAGNVECVYRNVRIYGRILHRDFEIQGDGGRRVVVGDATVVSRSESAGITWRSGVLLLIAVVAVWTPSLLRRLCGNATTSSHAG